MTLRLQLQSWAEDERAASFAEATAVAAARTAAATLEAAKATLEAREEAMNNYAGGGGGRKRKLEEGGRAVEHGVEGEARCLAIECELRVLLQSSTKSSTQAVASRRAAERQQRGEADVQRLRARRPAVSDSLAQLGAELSGVHARLHADERSATASWHAADEAAQHLAAHRASTASAQAQLAEASSLLTSCLAQATTDRRASAIRELRASLGAGGVACVHGFLCECLHVEPQHARAANAVLGSTLHSTVLVEDKTTALAVVRHFTRHKVGVITCLILAEASEAAPSASSSRGRGTSLADVIRSEPRFRPIVKQLAHGWQLVADASAALAAQAGPKSAEHAGSRAARRDTVTMQGALFRSSGEIQQVRPPSASDVYTLGAAPRNLTGGAGAGAGGGAGAGAEGGTSAQTDQQRLSLQVGRLQAMLEARGGEEVALAAAASSARAEAKRARESVAALRAEGARLQSEWHSKQSELGALDRKLSVATASAAAAAAAVRRHAPQTSPLPCRASVTLTAPPFPPRTTMYRTSSVPPLTRISTASQVDASAETSAEERRLTESLHAERARLARALALGPAAHAAASPSASPCASPSPSAAPSPSAGVPWPSLAEEERRRKAEADGAAERQEAAERARRQLLGKRKGLDAKEKALLQQAANANKEAAAAAAKLAVHKGKLETHQTAAEAKAAEAAEAAKATAAAVEEKAEAASAVVAAAAAVKRLQAECKEEGKAVEAQRAAHALVRTQLETLEQTGHEGDDEGDRESTGSDEKGGEGDEGEEGAGEEGNESIEAEVGSEGGDCAKMEAPSAAALSASRLRLQAEERHHQAKQRELDVGVQRSQTARPRLTAQPQPGADTGQRLAASSKSAPRATRAPIRHPCHLTFSPSQQMTRQPRPRFAVRDYRRWAASRRT